MKQSFDLTAKDYALIRALNNETWEAEVALGSATHGTDQSYYWYSTYSLSSSTTATGSSSDAETGSVSAGYAAMTGMATESVNSTIAIMMQKYLLSVVLTGNLNTKWADVKLYWPMYNESTDGVQIIFNDTLTAGEDTLANDQTKFWNKALWY